MLKGAVSNRRFETAPRAKKATVGFFAPGNLRFSLKNTIKFDRTMGENDGVEPSSKNHGGVDQMQNAFETPPFLSSNMRGWCSRITQNYKIYSPLRLLPN